jgi:hypothetical protein
VVFYVVAEGAVMARLKKKNEDLYHLRRQKSWQVDRVPVGVATHGFSPTKVAPIPI